MTESSLPTVAMARLAAHRWVNQQGAKIPGFQGAWLAGSIAWQPLDTLVPPWSDVDVMVVLDGTPPPKIGKFLYNNILLEVSFISAREVASELLAANYRVSCSFVQGKLLSDPIGELERVQTALQANFWTPTSVSDRINQALALIQAGLAPAPATETSLPWQVMWVFPAGLPTHLILLGAGMNPTVRRRYENIRPILAQVGRLELHESLLAATGYGDFTQSEVLGHWQATRTLFDLAAPQYGFASPPFASDIGTIARPISIDGTLNSIERGFHRESLFWLVATQARSLAILEEVAPHLITPNTTHAFERLVDRIGIATTSDRAARGQAILQLVPDLIEVAITLAMKRQP